MAVEKFRKHNSIQIIRFTRLKFLVLVFPRSLGMQNYSEICQEVGGRLSGLAESRIIIVAGALAPL